MTRPAAPATLAALLALLLLGSASAQVIRNPRSPGEEFEATVDVVGRIVDSQGWPVNQFFVDVALVGVEGVSDKPLRVGTNCNGDFGAVLKLGTIRGKEPRVVVSSHENQFLPTNASFRLEQPLDTFYRLNQFVAVLDEPWPSECGRAHDYWPGRVTVWGRFVEGTERYEKNGTRNLRSQPVPYWPIGLNVTLDTGGRFPPDSLIPTDEVGDFQYSWTFEKPVRGANLTAEAKGERVEVAMHPEGRVAFVKMHVGRDPPVETPGVALPLALAALCAVALALASRRR